MEPFLRYALTSSHSGGALMSTVTLSARPNGNGYQAEIAYSSGVSMSSAETYPTIVEAMTAAAMKLLNMPERLDAMDKFEMLVIS
jgi:hypothetical protein